MGKPAGSPPFAVYVGGVGFFFPCLLLLAVDACAPICGQPGEKPADGLQDPEAGPRTARTYMVSLTLIDPYMGSGPTSGPPDR